MPRAVSWDTTCLHVTSEVRRYLKWVEDKDQGDESNNATGRSNEGSMDDIDIDKLADIFIAKCHQKSILEKEGSFRRSQEMIAV